MKGIHQMVSEPLAGGQALRSARGKLLRDCLLLIGGGLLLSGIRIAGFFMPFAACMILAFPFGIRSVAAMTGAVAGYLLRCGSVEGIEHVAVAVLLFSASAVFQGTQLPAKIWFWPALALSVCGILGAVTLFGGGSHLAQWLLQCLAAGVGVWSFRSALCGNRRAQFFLAAAVIAGVKGIAAPMDIGVLLGAAACIFLQETQACAWIGILMDISGGSFYCLTASMIVPGILFGRSKQKDLLQPIMMLVGLCVFPLLFGSFSAGLVMSAAIGVGLGVLLRHWLPAPHLSADSGELSAAARLENAADILELLRKQIPERQIASASEAESVYDGAAEQICRCCARFHRCWQHRAEQTLAALNGASKTIIDRGVAQMNDFPQSFRENCCHLEGFITAVNQELEGMLFRRRYQMELRESRQVLSEEFRCVGEFLRSPVQTDGMTGGTQFRPMIGACSVGKNGDRINGDKGVCFAGKNRDYYVLLCDGMGSGKEASECSGETVRLLERLIKSGVEAENALKILNGLELLRAADRFTTIDLLRIDLCCGDGILYKWGSAPSFWRNCDSVKKIGTASLPPGVGVGGDHAPEQYRLSLKRGEMLVLASDGAVGTETEATICSYCGTSVHELAALLISDAPTEDDVSAVVISLKPYAS